MKISVIIPAYNAARFLGRSVDSVRGQSFDNWELIIVNDGSTDDTAAVCDVIARDDSRVRVIHTVNRGAYMARLTGILAAKGDWLTFVDADDTLPSEALTSLYSGVALHDDVDIVVGGINLNGKTLFRHKIDGLVGRDAYMAAMFGDGTSIGMCCKLFRRMLFARELPVATHVSQNEDMLMLLILAARARRVFVMSDKVCYNYIFREGSMSGGSMSVEAWRMLFEKLGEVIAPIESHEVHRAFLTMRLRRIYSELILKGVRVDTGMPVLAGIVKDVSSGQLSTEECRILELVRKPVMQRVCYLKYMLCSQTKKIIKRLIGYET